jgi:hypothetical protein
MAAIINPYSTAEVPRSCLAVMFST